MAIGVGGVLRVRELYNNNTTPRKARRGGSLIGNLSGNWSNMFTNIDKQRANPYASAHARRCVRHVC